MAIDSRSRRWVLWLTFGAALYGLNLLLSFHNVWPTPWITTRHQLSVEILALVLLMALTAEWGRPPSRRILGFLAIVLMLLMIGRYLEVTAPALYGRAINLYWDARYLPAVAAMLIRAASGWQLLLGAAGLAAILVLVVLGIRWMLARTAEALRFAIPRRISMAVSALLLILFVAGQMRPELGVRRWFSPPVTQTYARQLHFIGEAMRKDAGSDLDAAPLPISRLRRIAGADLILVFLESYGVTTLDQPAYADALAVSRDRFATAIAHTERMVVSARVGSPTFGGGSWRAHLSLLSGIEVRDNGRYQRLMTRDRETLVRRFADAGYRVLGLMPGLRMAWPEGRFYGYDRIYDATALDYRGPAFGWWRIPDQYALARLDRLELSAPTRPPVFVVFATISSHAPFRPVAPYQPDWDAVLGTAPYGPDGAASQLARKPEWTRLGSGYVEAIDYALTVLAGYLERRADADLVLIVLGDHQPPASVSGPEASWDVPVHIIASRPDLMQALRAEGFAPGLEPAQPAVGPMHALAPRLLRAFD